MNNTAAQQTPVYLLDDDPLVLEFLCQVVSLAEMQPHPFSSAIEFFERVHLQDSLGVIVLDLNMPGMDGIEVMRRLAESGVRASLVLISGYDVSVLHAAEKLATSHKLNLLGSLTKPLAFQDFLSLLEQVVVEAEPEVHKPERKSTENAKANELLLAIENNQMFLDYQPQLTLAGESITSVEALVRWNHPEQGVIGPQGFIPEIEKLGMISELTWWVVRTAVQQIRHWLNKGIQLKVSVNVSASDLESLDFPERLVQLLMEADVPPYLLKLELTESAVMKQPDVSADVLTRIRLKGFELSIDDFGTGYSSLVQLHRLPFSELKIDRAFVMQVANDDEARAIVRSCIVLGHELNMSIVAEGVETHEQLELIKSAGCDVIQGYLIGKPMAPDAIEVLLESTELLVY